MGDRVWQIPQEQFVAAWNRAATLADLSPVLRELAGGSVPRWAAIVRARALRKEGVDLKPLIPQTAAA
ncbi:hypothetical protein [Limnoglobus roseus]|uniref:Uncharacterized protein n=1 Tax=Limnoglobus roseus TaxID=2598579 RepID=A0A5C1A7V2_9BACT|nr:hypothetical protein [Limnoglobus roseus]QEL14820.1 hypothetical protein PX52LOC_01718 [Limnoglobus roseus]